MAHHIRRETLSGPFPVARFSDHQSDPSADSDLAWPFGALGGLDYDDVRETAYEIFFTACRSSPGFGGGRNALSFYSADGSPDAASSPKLGGGGGGVVVTTPTSRVKRALGLKMLKRSPSRRMAAGGGGGGGGGGGSNPASPSSHGGSSGASPSMSFTVPQAARPRRPMTSAEIMRQQMRVTEQNDNRLRKTLMRTLVGQMGRRAETIILPLELLRHLKPSEFNDSQEYHLWQKRQLKVLEAGLLLHPSIPLDSSNPFASRLRDIVRSGEARPVDTSKNSDTMRTLCNSVVSLSWRSPDGSAPADVCHWADGFPLNAHLYVALLRAVFDARDETLVLDEVDELLELMKKAWSTMGITRAAHNACFAWVLFHQYVATAMVEPDLLCAAHAVLAAEVAVDARREGGGGGGGAYGKIVAAVVGSMSGWAEKRLMRYHEYFLRGTAGQIECLLPVALAAARILGEDVAIVDGAGSGGGDGEERPRETVVVVGSAEVRVDNYIRSSVKNAFAKLIENGNGKGVKDEMSSEELLQLAKETERLALKERDCFSPTLRRWQPTAAAVAAVTLHGCYGAALRQYVDGVSALAKEAVEVLQRAGRLEKVLVQMVVEDSAECEDGGKSIVREMVPYEVDSVISNMLRMWIDERFVKGRDCLNRAKETETWNPKSKSEPHAQSAVELMSLAKQTFDDLLEIPIEITEDLALDVAHGWDNLFQDYTAFVSSCGSKQNYIPALPPLTRCSRDSKLVKLWKKASPCGINVDEHYPAGANADGLHPRQSTSRGTQRLYVRINTLHYLLSTLQSLEKSLSLSPKIEPSSARTKRAQQGNSSSSFSSFSSSSSYFERAQSSVQSAAQHVSEVAAYRLIFLDSGSVFYESLYVDDVANARIRPVLRILKQNLTLMCAILDDKVQAPAMREVMKAAFEAFLMVLLAGGSSRAFLRSDHEMIEEDFEGLKRVFCACGEGLITEGVVEREAETVEGVITLMGQCTEQVMEEFSIVTCETSGILGLGGGGEGQKLPMPATTGRWHRSDANTILRVLCHRNDKAANQFLKRMFQLAKRR